MTKDLAVIPSEASLAGELPALLADAVELAQGSRSAATRRAYERDFVLFERWCFAHSQTPFPARPELVAAYLAHLGQTYAAATIDRALTSIGQAHRAAGLASPVQHELVRQARRGLRRRIGVAQVQKTALVVEQLVALLAPLPDTLAGIRDRALLALGWAGGFRRSELVALNVEHIAIVSEGLRVTIARSKTDQEGRGRFVAVPRGTTEACPVRAVERLLAANCCGPTGPLFVGVNRWGQPTGKRLTGRDVARILKRRAAAAVGLDPRELAGHSLRAGLVTSASRAGRTNAEIQTATGHSTSAMVDRYRRETEAFAQAPSRGLL